MEANLDPKRVQVDLDMGDVKIHLDLDSGGVKIHSNGVLQGRAVRSLCVRACVCVRVRACVRVRVRACAAICGPGGIQCGPGTAQRRRTKAKI